MPLDANIILSGQQAPVQLQNPLDAAGKAMQFKSLADQSYLEGLKRQQMTQEFGDQQAIRHAYANNTKVDPNGAPSLDRTGVMSDLAKNAPHLVPQMQQSLASNDVAVMKGQLEKISANAQLLNGVKDQASYDQVKNHAIAMGSNPNEWPQQYDPNVVQSMQAKALSYKDNLDLQIKQKQSENEGKKLDVELFKTYGNPGGKSAKGPIDPAELVSKTVPPDRQAKVFDEIKAAQNTAKSAPEILAAFDRAAKNLHSADFVPGVHNADQKAMHALMGPTFQDVEGTVRQAAMDNMNENTTPQFGDSAKTIETKRNALVGYLTSKSAAPTAKGFGIDLSKFPSTSIDKKITAGNLKKSISSDSVSHSDLPVGSVSNGYVKTSAGWVPQGNQNASK